MLSVRAETNPADTDGIYARVKMTDLFPLNSCS